MPTEDPFRHHPQLRGLISPPESSFFRDFSPEVLDRLLAEEGLPDDWHFEAEEIEASRVAALSQHRGDLWVFAYGSLMWDPGVVFAEVRRARITGYARRFCLLDTNGGRGTPETPGVMAALDVAAQGQCDGLAFRLEASRVEAESRQLWNREMIAPAYLPRFMPAQTEAGEILALSFVADHTADMICSDLCWEDEVRFAATGRGFRGTSLAYVESLAGHFTALGIEAPEVSALLEAARRYAFGDSLAGNG